MEPLRPARTQPAFMEETQSQFVRRRRTTVAERFIQDFLPQTSGSVHHFDPQPQHFINRPEHYNHAYADREMMRAEADRDGSYSRSQQSYNRNEPYRINSSFMPNTMGRIAPMAGQSLGNFYSTRSTDPPETEYVTRRPSSRLRFKLPGENDSDQITDNSILEDPEVVRENFKKFRNWEYTTLGRLVRESDSSRAFGEGTRFTVLSYNVLAPGLLETHKYLYKQCNPKALEWDYRFELFLKEVSEFHADIVCLQEVEAQLFTSTYEPEMLKKGFRGVYKKRTREKEDGLAIFWKYSKFTLIRKLDVDYYQPHVPILDRDNVGLLVKLQSNIGRRPKLVVGTTHLLYNPKRNDVKLAQVQLLLSELDRFAFSGFSKSGETNYTPMVLTGDFNADPHNSIVRFLTDGELQYLGADGRRPEILLKNGMSDFIPVQVGISDQCQHYKVVLERYKIFRSIGKNVFEMDLSTQAQLVNLYPTNLKAPGQIPGCSTLSSFASNIPVRIPSTARAGINSSNEVEVIDISDDTEEARTAKISKNEKGQIDQARFIFDSREHARLLAEIYKTGTVCTFGSGELSHKLRLRNAYSPKLDRLENNDDIATTRQNVWTCVDYIFYSTVWSDAQRRRVEGNLKLLRRLGLMSRNQCKENGPLPSLACPSDHFPLVTEFILK